MAGPLLPGPDTPVDSAFPPLAFDPRAASYHEAAPAWARIGARKPGPRVRPWDVVLWVDLGLLGLLLLVALAAGIQAFLGGGLPEQDLSDPFERDLVYVGLWVQAVILLLLAGVVPFAWAWGTRVGGWRGAVAYFGLDRPLLGIAQGLGVTALIFVAVILLGLALHASGQQPENPQVDMILQVIDWPLAVMLSVGAGVGEEILFRGYLQRRIGLFGQAVLFGLAHASYATVLQLVIPFALGLLFGWLVHRRLSLWAPIVAHFLFDFLQMALALTLGDQL